MDRELVIAVEELLVAIDEGDLKPIHLNKVIDALGHDPRVKFQTYSVSLDIEVEASSAEEAIVEFVRLVEEDGLRGWIYEVSDEYGSQVSLDGYVIVNK